MLGRKEDFYDYVARAELAAPATDGGIARLDDFVACYDRECPHQALTMKYPAELYQPSPYPYRDWRSSTIR